MRAQLFLTVLLAIAGSLAPQRPDFTGVWVATTDAPRDLPPAPSPVFGARFGMARQDGHTVLTRLSRDGAFSVSLPESGAEVRWRVPGRACEGDSERIEKIAIEGESLVYTLVGTVAPGATEPRIINVRYPIRAEGPDRIAVQGTMAQQGQPRAVATVYRRSSERMPAETPRVALPIKGAAARATQAAWIGQTWIGEAPNNVTVEERWTPPASGAMLGIGRTVRGTQMTGFEFLCIAEREGTLVYFAMPNARMPATPFVLTSVAEGAVTFENPSHDFPKLIRYARLADGSLQTAISGGAGTKETTFVLKPAR